MLSNRQKHSKVGNSLARYIMTWSQVRFRLHKALARHMSIANQASPSSLLPSLPPLSLFPSLSPLHPSSLPPSPVPAYMYYFSAVGQ